MAESTGAQLSNFKNELRGCGPFLHDDPRDRPGGGFRRADHAAHRPGRESYVLVPVIPPKPDTTGDRHADEALRILALARDLPRAHARWR